MRQTGSRTYIHCPWSMVKGRTALLVVLLVMAVSLHGEIRNVVKITSPQVQPLSLEMAQLQTLVLETVLVLEVKNVVVMVPSDFNVSSIGTKLWAKGVSTEVHLYHQEPPAQPSYSSHHNRGSANGQTYTGGVPVEPTAAGTTYNSTGSVDIWFPNVDSRFLYGRDVLFRRRMAVLVLGPTDWVLSAVLQLMPRGVFGPWDTLILAPVGSSVRASVLCPFIPVATRMVVLEVQRATDAGRCVGLVREARLVGGGRYALRSVGCWRKRQFVLRAPLLPQITSLEGATLSIRILGSTNEITVTTEGDSLVIEGYLGQMLKYFMKNLKFTPEFNGRDKYFKDYLDALGRRESDLAVATLSLLPKRAEIFDFSEWYWIINNKFITKVPRVLDDSFLLFQIFQWQTWCVIAGFLVVSSAMLAVTWRVTDEDGKPALGKTRRRVHIAVTTALKTAVYMGSKELPHNAAGRLVLTGMWLVVIILVALYNGSLTAFLSIPRVERVPQTVRQLIDMGYTLSINNVFSQYVKFKNSPIADHQVAFREAEVRSHDTILPPEVYISRARTQPLALLVNNWAAHELLNTHVKSIGSVKVCTLKTSSEPLFLEIGALGFPKNSPLKRLFDRQMSWIRITKLIEVPGRTCVMASLRSEEAEPLGMVKMAGVIVLWVAGVAVACVLFLAEVIYSELHKR